TRTPRRTSASRPIAAVATRSPVPSSSSRTTAVWTSRSSRTRSRTWVSSASTATSPRAASVSASMRRRRSASPGAPGSSVTGIAPRLGARHDRRVSDAARLGPVLTVHGAEVRVGTCSWADRTLVRETDWYPRRTMSAAERLAHYPAHFPVVEADSTYYRPPSRQLTAGWAERSPAGFRMDVKAYSLMTGHPTKPETLGPDVAGALAPGAPGTRSVCPAPLPGDAVEEAWRRFADALAPVPEAGKLGAVLLQYPPWFTPKRANREELARARRRGRPSPPRCGAARRPRGRRPTTPSCASTGGATTPGRPGPRRRPSGSATSTTGASCARGSGRWRSSPSRPARSTC